MFRSDNNHLFFSGQVTDDILPVSAALHNLIKNLDTQILCLTSLLQLSSALRSCFP